METCGRCGWNTDERASSEDQKHTSGGVFVAVDSNLGAVVGGEGTVTSIPGNKGRNAQVWLNVRGGMRMFAASFWHTEGGCSGSGAEKSQNHEAPMADSM